MQHSSNDDQNPDRAKDFAALALVVAACGLLASLIGLRGDFPLNDDWSYAWATRSLCQGDGLDLLPWTGASLVFQAWYGALACRLGGFSFEVLRATTLATALIGVVAAYVAVLQGTRDRRAASFAALTLALNPLYTNLSFTFMTDVPAAAFGLMAAACFCKSRQGAQIGWVTLGAVLCSAATLIRQPLLLVGLGGAIAFVLASDLPRAQRLRAAAIAAAPGALTFVAWSVWISNSATAPAAVANKVNEALALTPLLVGSVTYKALLTTGLLLLPITLALPLDKALRRPTQLIFAGLSAAAFFLWVREGALMFYLPNILYDFGLGALTTRDTAFLALGRPVALGNLFQVLLTIVSILGTTRLLLVCWERSRDLLLGAAAPLSWSAFLIAAAALLQSAYFFDRYLIASLACLSCALLTSWPKPEFRGPALLSLALFGLFSITATHDYLQWNRARFALVSELEGRGVQPEGVDAGMDVNGWKLAKQVDSWPTDEDARPGQSDSKKSWWWVVDDEWILSFRRLDGYEVVLKEPYAVWLPPGGERQMLALRRSHP